MKKLNWGSGLALAITVFVIATLSVVSYLISLDFFLVTNEHYEEGVEYQQTIDQKKRSSELEDPVVIVFDEKLEALRVVFPNNFVGKAQGDVKLYRPNNPEMDKKLPLSVNANGIQLISTSALEKGKWVLKIEWNADEKSYLEEKTIII
ncbi:MAG: FixH family protein [Balneola sp.]